MTEKNCKIFDINKNPQKSVNSIPVMDMSKVWLLLSESLSTLEAENNLVIEMREAALQSDLSGFGKCRVILCRIITLVEKESESIIYNPSISTIISILQTIKSTITPQNTSEMVKLTEKTLNIKKEKEKFYTWILASLVMLLQNLVNLRGESFWAEFQLFKKCVEYGIYVTSLFTDTTENEPSKNLFHTLLKNITEDENINVNETKRLIDNSRSYLRVTVEELRREFDIEKTVVNSSDVFQILCGRGLPISRNEIKEDSMKQWITKLWWCTNNLINNTVVLQFMNESNNTKFAKTTEIVLPFLNKVESICMEMVSFERGVQPTLGFKEGISKILKCSDKIKICFNEMKKSFKKIEMEIFKKSFSNFIISLHLINNYVVKTKVDQITERCEDLVRFRKKALEFFNVLSRLDGVDPLYLYQILGDMLKAFFEMSSKEVLSKVVQEFNKSISKIFELSPLFIPIFSFELSVQKYVFQHNVTYVLVECQQYMKYLSSFLRNSKEGGIYLSYEQDQLRLFITNSFLKKKLSVFPCLSAKVEEFLNSIKTQQFQSTGEMAEFIYEKQSEFCKYFTPQADFLVNCMDKLKMKISTSSTPSGVHDFLDISEKAIIIDKMLDCYILCHQLDILNKHRAAFQKCVSVLDEQLKTSGMMLKVLKETVVDLRKELNTLYNFFISVVSASSSSPKSEETSSDKSQNLGYTYNEERVISREYVEKITDVLYFIQNYRKNGQKILNPELQKLANDLIVKIERIFLAFFQVANFKTKQELVHSLECIKQNYYFVNTLSQQTKCVIISMKMKNSFKRFISAVADIFYLSAKKKFEWVVSVIKDIVKENDNNSRQFYIENMEDVLIYMRIVVQIFELYEPNRVTMKIVNFFESSKLVKVKTKPVDFSFLFSFDFADIELPKNTHDSCMFEGIIDQKYLEMVLEMYCIDIGLEWYSSCGGIEPYSTLVFIYNTAMAKLREELPAVLKDPDEYSRVLKLFEAVDKTPNDKDTVKRMMVALLVASKEYFKGKILNLPIQTYIYKIYLRFKKGDIDENLFSDFIVAMKYFIVVLKQQYMCKYSTIIQRFNYLSISTFFNEMFELVNFMFSEQIIDECWCQTLKLFMLVLVGVGSQKIENVILPLVFFYRKCTAPGCLLNRVVQQIVLIITNLVDVEMKLSVNLTFNGLFEYAYSFTERFTTTEKYSIIAKLEETDENSLENVFNNFYIFQELIMDEMMQNNKKKLFGKFDELLEITHYELLNLLQYEGDVKRIPIKELLTKYFQYVSAKVKLLSFVLSEFEFTSVESVVQVIDEVKPEISTFQNSTLELYLPSLHKLSDENAEASSETIRQIISLVFSIVFQPLGCATLFAIRLRRSLNLLKMMDGDEKKASVHRNLLHSIQTSLFEIKNCLEISCFVIDTTMKRRFLDEFSCLYAKLTKENRIFSNKAVKNILSCLVDLVFDFVSSDFFTGLEMLIVCHKALMVDQQTALKQAYRLKLLWCEFEPCAVLYDGMQIPSLKNFTFYTKSTELEILNLIERILNNDISCYESFNHINSVIHCFFKIHNFVDRHIRIAFEYYNNKEVIDIAQKDFDLIGSLFANRGIEREFVDESEDFEFVLKRFVRSISKTVTRDSFESIKREYLSFKNIYIFSVLDLVANFNFFGLYNSMHKKTVANRIDGICLLFDALEKTKETLVKHAMQSPEPNLPNLCLRVIETLFSRMSYFIHKLCDYENVDFRQEEEVLKKLLTVLSSSTQVIEHFTVYRNVMDVHMDQSVRLAFNAESAAVINAPTTFYSLGQLIVGGVSKGVLFKATTVLATVTRSKTIWNFSKKFGVNEMFSLFVDYSPLSSSKIGMVKSIITTSLNELEKKQYLFSVEKNNEFVVEKMRCFLVAASFDLFNGNNKHCFMCLNRISVCIIGFVALLQHTFENFEITLDDAIDLHKKALLVMDEDDELAGFLIEKFHMILNRISEVLIPKRDIVSSKNEVTVVVDRSLVELHEDIEMLLFDIMSKTETIAGFAYSQFVDFTFETNAALGMLIVRLTNSFYLTQFQTQQDSLTLTKLPISRLLDSLGKFSNTPLIKFMKENISISELYENTAIPICFYSDTCLLFSFFVEEGGNSDENTSPLVINLSRELQRFSKELQQNKNLQTFKRKDALNLVEEILTIIGTFPENVRLLSNKIKMCFSNVVSYVERIQTTQKSDNSEFKILLKIIKFGIKTFSDECTASTAINDWCENDILIICCYLQIIVTNTLAAISSIDSNKHMPYKYSL
ncbi:hypothetical protein EIN_429120 [Entamoeba invadens IP1]|uniref:Uncharacterized protein n=1 Tax=Entamoeba invadens IP1 TaxID=370355 RepID=A0A0A1UEY2_ENTIV|nr:hypothetical protein EIN_429120 [Entamoeba invadens IP1]ELP95166.1 hypothetical protein EIN_429120 [Entamoeba invadens IP1]|eukprot:XP_004261937.1 hypothetical protein EIN_429120 [Entamoeba invadens IP1]